MMIFRIFTFVYFIVCLSSTYANSETIGNTMCPVMPDEEIDINIFTEYEESKVYFCCKKCLKNFIKTPEKYTENLPQKDLNSHGHGNEKEHDHATHEKSTDFLSHFLNFIGKFHPVSVHFPIALILTAAFIEILAWWTKKSFFADMARLIVVFSLLTTILAVTLGWIAGAFSNYPGELDFIKQVHQKIAQKTLLQYNAMQTDTFRLLKAKQREIQSGKDYVEFLYNYWLSDNTIEQILQGKISMETEKMEMNFSNTENQESGEH